MAYHHYFFKTLLMFISTSHSQNSQLFHSPSKSGAFGAKNPIYKAAEAENPEQAIETAIKKTKLTPEKLTRQINKRVSTGESDNNRLTEQTLHRLLRNPRVTKKSVDLLLTRGAELHPDLTIRNFYAIKGYPYTTFLEAMSRNPAVQQLKIFFERAGKRSQLIEQSNLLDREVAINTLFGKKGAETSHPRSITSFDMEATQEALDKVEHMRGKRAVLEDLKLSVPVGERDAYKTWKMMGTRPRVRISSDDAAQDPIPNRLKNPAVIKTLYELFPRRSGSQQAHKKEFRNFIQELVAWDYVVGDKLKYRVATTNYDVSNWVNKWNAHEQGRVPVSNRPTEVFDAPSVKHRRETGRLLSSVTDEIMAQLSKRQQPRKRKR